MNGLTIGDESMTTNCLQTWYPGGWSFVSTPYAPPDVLAHAKTRLQSLDLELSQVEAKRAEAEMLRRMIAAAETK